MLFVNITVAIGVLDFILHWLGAAKARHMFKNRYPELKIPKTHWSEIVLSYIKMVFCYFCPILNIMFTLVYLFKTDELCDKTVAKVYQRCIAAEEK